LTKSNENDIILWTSANGVFLYDFLYEMKVRNKSCAQKLHWLAQTVSNVITTQQKRKKIIQTVWKPKNTAAFATNILHTVKQNKQSGAYKHE